MRQLFLTNHSFTWDYVSRQLRKIIFLQSFILTFGFKNDNDYHNNMWLL